MPDILHRVGIAAEPMRVFEALTTVEGTTSSGAKAGPNRATRRSQSTPD
jgi:hypothetical protein